MQKKQFLVLLLVLNVMAIACAQSSRTVSIPVPLKVIRNGLQNLGESKSAEAIWISNEDLLKRMVSRVPRKMVVSPQPVPPPDIDFVKYGILLIRMGEKPTSGYGLELMADLAEIENRVALVSVRWIEPESGAITAQVITFPYLMIQMAKGAYDRIAVIDQDGLAKFHVEVTQ